MMTGIQLPISQGEDCGCCSLAGGESAVQYGCEERRAVFTPREQKVLQRIREAALRARAIKEELTVHERNGSADSVLKHDALEELEELRRLRRELEKERIAAAEERMRLLGHL